MGVDELARLRLANKAVNLFGEKEAQTLMEHLPLGGIANLATKDDLFLTKAELRAQFEQLRADFEQLRAEFEQLRADFERLRADVAESMRRQTITLITVMTTINAVMFAGLKWG
ncbi:MAG: hypothetical protein RLY19_897 [Actinomycetota bacterium]